MISRPDPPRPFDLVKTPWFFPLILLGLFLPLRIFAPQIAEKPELAWLDEALSIRAKLDFASALDPSIHFVELSIDDEIARRFAAHGELATTASVLKTIAALGARVIVVDIIYAYGREEDQALLAGTINEIQAAGGTTVVLALSQETRPGMKPYLLRSLPLAGGADLRQGVVNVKAGKNWREYQMVHRMGVETLPSIALAAFGASRPGPLAPKQNADGRMEWKTLGRDGKTVISTADDSRVFLNLSHSYYDDHFDKREGIEERFWKIAELEKRASEGEQSLLDATVFFGFDAEYDGKPTTHGDMEPGMFLHGTALNDLLHDRSIRPAPLWLDLVLFLVVAFLAAAVFSLVNRKRRLILVALAGVPLILIGGWFSIWFLALLPSTANAALLWGAAVFFEAGRRWTLELRERTQRDAMLGFYFSPAVLKQVTKNLDMIRPQGNQVAVLLSDLRGFTTLCETQAVERVFELLNRLFGVETDAALRENGSLARFAGDQFLAYWGAPEPCSDAADRALRAALEIQRILRARREAAAADDLDSWLRIGIGLHCGLGLVGHVGSRSYRDYNLVGDSVNTTARVEGQTKNYAASILATGEFISALTESPAHLLVDRVQVKGKAKASELHAVFEPFSDALALACQEYRMVFEQYTAGDFSAAISGFERLALDPSDTISTSAKLLAVRCRDLASRPPKDWNGVFELTSK